MNRFVKKQLQTKPVLRPSNRRTWLRCGVRISKYRAKLLYLWLVTCMPMLRRHIALTSSGRSSTLSPTSYRICSGAFAADLVKQHASIFTHLLKTQAVALEKTSEGVNGAATAELS